MSTYRAFWNNTCIASSDSTIEVEGNQYFPPESVNSEYLEESKHESTCYWKGKANYYHINIDGKLNENAAWQYQDPSEKAQKIKGVNISKDD